MNITDFTLPQRQALLDLLVLGMYADGHLAVAEDEKLQELLTTMGFATRYDRSRQLDAAVTRVRQHSQTAEAARAHAGQLAQGFTTPEQRRAVCNLLEQLMSSDKQVTPPEGRFATAVREILRV